MKDTLIIDIEQNMASILDNCQMEHLHNILLYCLFNFSVIEDENNEIQVNSEIDLSKFLFQQN